MRRLFYLFVLLSVALVDGWGTREARAQGLFEDKGILDTWKDRFDVFQKQEDEVCVVTGCSNELCMPKGTDIDVSPCIWKEEYACYSQAKCEKQSDNKCGWTQTTALQQCIDQARQPTLTVTLTPSKTLTQQKLQPVCGNQVCEVEESNYWDCEACSGLFCMTQSCVLRLGLCTPDCPPVSTQPPTPTPTPTRKPLLINLRKTPTPTLVVTVTPTPGDDEEDKKPSWVDEWLARLSELF